MVRESEKASLGHEKCILVYSVVFMCRNNPCFADVEFRISRKNALSSVMKKSCIYHLYVSELSVRKTV